jgi:amino acid adenylation domain-containing protein
MTQAQNNPRTLPPAEWLGGATEYPRDTPVHVLFQAVAGTTPDAIALVNAAGYLTYAELNTRANRLAHHLLTQGLAPGAPVALCLDRSPELIVALLAILKAGGCYVPLDPAYPAERLAGMAEDCAASLLVTTRSLAETLPTLPATSIYLEDLPQDGPTADPAIAVAATGPAYIMFTSGSTGRPKGVAVPHRAIVRLVRGQDYVSLTPEETFLQFAPASFDASTLEIWGPLLNGGRVAIAPAGQLSLQQIAGAVRSLGVTSLWLTSGLFNLMADEQPDAFATLRQLLAGGDVLSVPHLLKVSTACPRLRIINGYGPTESTTFACCHTITPADLALPSVPIGKPIANTTVRILDSDGAPVPEGEAGELYIGGDGLAIGYWNQPVLTAEKFVTLAGERYYRTGDRVRWLPGGLIQFLGRQDHQVKVRGYRIELGEIEATLAAQPGVNRCAVVALGSGADKQLAAYHTGPAEPAELRTHLRQQLPDYMVPAFFTRLESLPLNGNGKVDRANLPSPAALSSPGEEPEIPLNDLEKTLSTLWSEVLGIPSPGLNQNFFDIGGTSLKLVEAHSRLVRAMRRQIPVTALFQYPTIAALAAFLAPDAARTTAKPVSRLAAAAERARIQRDALARKQLSQKAP